MWICGHVWESSSVIKLMLSGTTKVLNQGDDIIDEVLQKMIVVIAHYQILVKSACGCVDMCVLM